MATLATVSDYARALPHVGEQLFKTKNFSDSTFLVGNGDDVMEIKVHRAILMSRSKVFEAMFNEKWNNNCSNESSITISIPDTTATVFNEFLQFLYTNNIAYWYPTELLYLADKYDVSDLLESVSEILIKRLPLNINEIYRATKVISGLKNLHDTTMEYLYNNMDRIVSMPLFLKLDLELLIEVIKSDNLCSLSEAYIFLNLMRWGSAKLKEAGEDEGWKNMRAKLGPIIYHVRYPLMSQEDFTTHVARTNLLNYKEMLSFYFYKSRPNEEVTKFNTNKRKIMFKKPQISDYTQINKYAGWS